MRIALAVTGSIAAYKTYDLARDWVKKGHQVRVMLSAGALKFVNPQVYRYLGVEEVYDQTSDWEYPKNPGDENVLHITLSNWIERLIIAPMSANTASRLARGEASDFLSTVFLALPKKTPIICFPAMNPRMWEHEFVQENISSLRRLAGLERIFVVRPDEGTMACGDEGVGKLPPVELIAELALVINPFASWNRRVLIVTGATRSPMDDVRFLTNPSSGMTGFYLAMEAHQRGDLVTLIKTVSSDPKLDWLNVLPGITIHTVETTEQMKAIVMDNIENHDLYLSPAALSDISFETQAGKFKKEDLGDSVKIKPAPDVLSHVLKARNEKQKIVAFAALPHLDIERIKEKYQKKPVDLLIATAVYRGDDLKERQGFNAHSAEYLFYSDTETTAPLVLSKRELAKKIFEHRRLNS